MNRRGLVCAALLAASTSTACVHVRPWERAKLAHPTMASSLFPGPAEGHVYAVQEGAVGGATGVESGCGCN